MRIKQALPRKASSPFHNICKIFINLFKIKSHTMAAPPTEANQVGLLS
jgi:hypothetical protein